MNICALGLQPRRKRRGMYTLRFKITESLSTLFESIDCFPSLIGVRIVESTFVVGYPS